ncbi:uncharacterized protein LOC135471735 isoform X1 [Liolophura sinensis]|uniref:uncharacterized protein LOC135471735 isoform X1 n=1 Tax=Liolophura sinensis TaxID=3198878 RepID=UPI00315962F1
MYDQCQAQCIRWTENEVQSSSLVELGSPDEDDIFQEELLEGETVLDRAVEGYDNLGFGSDEENEQDLTMTDEMTDQVYLSGKESQSGVDTHAQLSNTVEDESDVVYSLTGGLDRNNSANNSERLLMAPLSVTGELVKPSSLNTLHIVKLKTKDSPETTMLNEGDNFESSTSIYPVIPPSEATFDVQSADEMPELQKSSLPNSSDKDMFSHKETKPNPNLSDTSKVDTDIGKEVSSRDFCKLLSGQVVLSPDNKLDIISKEEPSETNEVFLTTSSEPCLTDKGRMYSTETEGGSSEGDRDRLQSESDVTDASELKEGARGSSSSTAAGASGKKKRNRSESKKRRKRKHIEKAAAMRESISTSQTQSEPSSPQQLKKSGSGKRSGRKAKGAILMTNLLVLDMGLSDPGPDLCGGEPGAVFLPLSKKSKSESEESIFDDAGSVADDESETDFKAHHEAYENTSLEDQAYLTPEAVSPEDEIPEPSFVADRASANDTNSTSKKEECDVEPDSTICAMFKRTIGLLTRRQTQIESNAEMSKPQLESDPQNTVMSTDRKFAHSESGAEGITHPQCIKEDTGPIIRLIKPVSDRKSVAATQSVDHHAHTGEVPCEMDNVAKSDVNRSIQEPTIFSSPHDNQELESGLVSPKLHRDHRQSFLFHNRFIQEDIQKKSAGPPTRPEGKILGRRRHRSAGTGVTRTSLSESSDGQSISPTVSEDILNTDQPGDNAGPHSLSERTTTRKLKLNTRFVKDNLFFASDKNKAKKVKVETSALQGEVVTTSKPLEKGSSGSLGKVLRASFKKLRRSKPKSAVSTQDLSMDQTVTEVQSQIGSLISSFGNSTPCLMTECYAPSYTGAESNAGVKIDPIEEDQDVVQSRIHLTSWDPTPLLKELYAVRLLDETTEDLSHRFISMEGVMEKLPMGKRKSTLLKTWKRRYFKAADGWLHYYEHNNYEKPCHSFQLMGGSIEVLDSRILGIDDGRGHYLMVRCPTPNDFENWRVSLESQTTDNVKAVHVRPVLNSQPHPSKKVVIIDIGSASVRAGILGKEASLPQVFFPTVVAKKTSSGECVVGFDAYRPDIRNQSTLHYPIRPSVKVDKFNIDMSLLPYVFDKIFSDLKVDSKCYWVLLSTPQMLADKLKTEIMDVLTRRCGVQGVCIAPQALLAMYSYKATSGIIVDVGERIDILPISDGYIVEGGVTRHPFGGEKVADSLKQSLTRLHYHFFSEVERLIIRHVMEKTCYIPHVFSEEMKQFQENPGSFSKTVSLKNFGLPEGTYSEVTHDEGCFRSAEGFFDTNIWGTDFPSLHKLVHKAIIECPMDNRREMCRSIFLSGGVTLLPGFAERLEREITKLVPPGLTIQVHASPQRYHSAFIGGCTLAAQDLFQQTCISREDWIKNGVKELKKWHIPS